MKKNFIFTLLFCCLSILSFANDWEFGSVGEHIIPLQNSNVSIKKEKITLKLTEEGMLVNVKFTFDSPVAEKKIIGFITPESGNSEEDGKGREPQPLEMENFKTVVNGKEVKSNVELLSKLLSKGILDNNIIKEYKEKEANFYNYVYYFTANFQKGENIVEHSYFYTGSSGVFERDFEYVVTTISKWKNKTVEDFEIEVQPGKAFVTLPYTFWKDAKQIDWEIVGKGKIIKIAPTAPNNEDGNRIDKYGIVYAKLDNGSVRYKTKNFSPDEEFYMTRVTSILGVGYDFPEGKIQGYKFKDKYFDIIKGGEIEVQDLEGLSDKELDIIRNYPYALSGYAFDRKDLNDYFSQFFWYSPVGKNVKFDEYYSYILKNISRVINEIRTNKKK
ncbi:YARHG domain-containing protein [Fusobacterium russii]|uniref:YARHG domain-containing protein n=1 Tax=Fusobacterium russii TaxID=854 RepID=UPI0003A7999E|nr:YARHG domain-containing protein [Fusobacterium russii]